MALSSLEARYICSGGAVKLVVGRLCLGQRADGDHNTCGMLEHSGGDVESCCGAQTSMVRLGHRACSGLRR